MLRTARVDDNGRWIIRWITPKDRVNDGETDGLPVGQSSDRRRRRWQSISSLMSHFNRGSEVGRKIVNGHLLLFHL